MNKLRLLKIKGAQRLFDGALTVFYRAFVEFAAISKNLDRYGKIMPVHGNEDYEGSRVNEKELREFLISSYETTRFWRSRMDEYGVNVYIDSPHSILEKLPNITKGDVIANKHGITPPLLKRVLMFSKRSVTGGSSGQGLQFYTSRRFRMKQWRTWQRHWYTNGVPVDENKIWVGGKNIFPNWYNKKYVYSYFAKTIYLNIYLLDKSDFPIITMLCRKHKIRWIHGYPSTVSDMISKYAALQDKIEFATVSSETLLPSQQALFLKYNIQVSNHYGMSEGVLNISNICGSWVSDDDFGLLQRINSEGVSPAVGTGYNNKAFPLINYLVGDDLEFENHEVVGVVGRVDDFLLTPSGKKLFRLDHLFKGLEIVIRAQLVQTDKLYAKCILDLSDNNQLTRVEEIIQKRFHKMTSEKFTLVITTKESFISTSNGKIKMVVNKLK